MKTFIQWAEENKRELPTLDENGKRTNLAYWAYPSATGRGNYPDGYFMPSSADAGEKMGYAKNKNGVRPNDKK